MDQPDELSNVGRLHRARFHHACKLFYDVGPIDHTAYEQANTICRDLLMDPRLGDLYAAGAHYILSFSDDNFLYHAEEAVKGYEAMYATVTATPKQTASRDILVASAKFALSEAQAYERYLNGEAMEEGEKTFREVEQVAQEEEQGGPAEGTWEENGSLARRAELEDLLNAWDEGVEDEEGTEGAEDAES